MPRSAAGRGAEVERQHGDVVAEPPEAEIRQQGRRDGSVVANRQALVPDIRDAAQADKLGAAALAERRRAVAQEVGEREAPEQVRVAVHAVIHADVELIAVEGLAAAGDEVLARAVFHARGIGPRNQIEQGLRLVRESSRRDDVAVKLRPVLGPRTAGGIEDVDAVLAEIAPRAPPMWARSAAATRPASGAVPDRRRRRTCDSRRSCRRRCRRTDACSFPG